MLKQSCFVCIGLLLISCFSQGQSLQQPDFSQGPLKVSDNQRYLVFQDGEPFFWLGDTAWELFHRLDREEADQYLQKRADQGFTVIQAVVLAELEGLGTPNAYGARPLMDLDPTRPNEAYFEHVDYIVERAAALGLYIGMLPSWGEWVTPRFGEPVFESEEQAYRYGHFLGKRYADQSNIIWILGGDRLPTERPEGSDVWRAMAEGIADGVGGENSFDQAADYSSTLMTYHCYEPSTNFFSGEEWIDFHSYGSYHNPQEEARSYQVAHQMQQATDLPIINLEPAYEEITRNYHADARLGYFDDADVRRHAYWSVFAGAFGHTYGAHPVWQMYSPAVGPRSTYTRKYWYEVLDYPGAQQMSYLKALLASRPLLSAQSDQSLLSSSAGGHAEVLRGEHHVMIYLPEGQDREVDLTQFAFEKLKAWWYNPRDGASLFLAEYETDGTQTFYPPGDPGPGNDWVLVLDNADKDYPPPGQEQIRN